MADSMSERDAFYNDALDFAFEAGLSREDAYAFADQQKAIRDRSIRRTKRRTGSPSARIRDRMAQEQPASGGGGGTGGLAFDVSRDLLPVESYDPRSEEEKRRNPMPPGVEYRYRMDRNLYPDMDTPRPGEGGETQDGRGLRPGQDAGGEAEPVAPESEPESAATSDLRRRIQQFGYTPGLQQLGREQAEGRQKMRDLLTDQYGRIQEGQERLGDMYSEAADVYRKQQAGMQMLQKANAEARQEAMAEIKDVENSISNFRIDPNRAFPTLGGRILAAVSVAVGAFAQGLSGGKLPNTALKIIMDAVNKDIDAQKAEFQTRKTVLQNRNNLYAQLLNTHGQEEKARQLAMNGALHHAQMRIQQVSNTIAGQKAQQGIQRLLQQIDNAATENRLDLIKTAKDNKYRSLSLELGLERKSGGGGQASRQERSQTLIQRAVRLLDKQVATSLALHNKDQKDKNIARLRRAVGSALFAVGADTGAYLALPEEGIEVFDGNIIIGQTLMKAFQGGNPSNQDARTFMRILPPLAVDHPIREKAYRALQRWAIASTENGTKYIQPGALHQAAKDGVFGKLEDLAAAPSTATFKSFKEEAGIVTLEDKRRRGF